jgi:hypothetical protein
VTVAEFVTQRIVDMVERAYREGYRQAAEDGRLPAPPMSWTAGCYIRSRARMEVEGHLTPER